MEARAGLASMKIVCLTAFLVVLFPRGSAEAATVHPCSADAVAQAKKLLVFYLHLDDGTTNRQWSVDHTARKIGGVRQYAGSGVSTYSKSGAMFTRGVIGCTSSMPWLAENAY